MDNQGWSDLLTDKVAIVTGAGTGTGRAEARLLAAAGASVVVNDLGVDVFGAGGDEAPGRAVVDEIHEAGGIAVAHFGDVSNWDSATALVETAIRQFGRLDIVVNNAGIIAPLRIIPDMTLDELDRMMGVHVRGSFAMTILATRYWREEARNHGPTDVCIVNTSSESILVGSPWRVDYAAAKSAIVGLTIGTAVGCSHFGVRANAILPRAFGRMSTYHGGGSRLPTAPEALDAESPDDVAPLVVALAGPQGQSISGQLLTVSGRSVQVLKRPEVAAEFHSAERWTPAEVGCQLAEHFATSQPSYGRPLSTEALSQLERLGS